MAAPVRKYNLRDFEDYGKQNFSHEFKTIADDRSYTFVYKNYKRSPATLRRHKMLLVAHYYFRGGGPPVWAFSTGANIHCYSGEHDENLVQRLDKKALSRIYYEEPFSFMAGSQDSKGMTPDRKIGQALVETVIHFLFLKHSDTPQFIHSPKTSEVNLFNYFEMACRNLGPNRRRDAADQRFSLAPDYVDPDEQATVQDTQIVGSAQVATLVPVKKERSATDAHVEPALDRRQSEDLPHRQKKYSSIVEQLIDHENNIRAEVEQEKTNLQAEIRSLKTGVQALQQQLVEQEGENAHWKKKHNDKSSQLGGLKKTCSERGVVMKELEVKNADLEAELVDLRKKYGGLEEEVDEWKTKCGDQEASRKEWKSKYVGLKRGISSLMEETAGTPVNQAAKR